MEMLQVFIDTSSLPRKPGRLGVKFDRLCQLANSELVKVFLSEVVFKEWTTQFSEEFYKNIHETVNALTKITNHPWVSEINNYNIVKQWKDILTISQAEAYKISELKVKEIIKKLKAEILLIDNSHGRNVMNDYFAGMPPFKTVKNREDIPDSFIFHCVKNLCVNLNSKIHCIVSDGSLKSAISGLDLTTVYGSIDEFVKSDVVEEIIKMREREIIWKSILDKAINHVKSKSKKLRDDINSLIIDELAGTFISHPEIPSDEDRAFIVSVDEPEDITLEWNETDDFGPGLLVVPFGLKCEVSVEFPIYHSDAYSLPEDVWVHIGDHEEDDFFDAGCDLLISVEGNLAVELDMDNFEKSGIIEIKEVQIDEIIAKHVLERTDGSIFG
jgi:hypothetical protein